MRIRSILFLAIFAVPGLHGQDCGTNNFIDTDRPWTTGNNFADHKSGYHNFTDTGLGGFCQYSNTTPGGQCPIYCTGEKGHASYIEVQGVTYSISHNLAIQENYGSGGSNGDAVTCGATVAATVTACTFGCAATIGFSGGVMGVGVSISFPPKDVFAASHPHTTTCSQRTMPYKSGCCLNPTMCFQGGGQYCDQGSCSCVGGSPIIIDTTGKLHVLTDDGLTSSNDGVVFDVLNNGRPGQWSWTTANSGIAFLVLDRNENGRIDNGGELFGNHTALSTTATSCSSDPSKGRPCADNGYLALAEFDKLENGGNGDGMIDWRDAVYVKLKLWVDVNHDGISQPSELHNLADLGVYSLGLGFKEEPYKDPFGNSFRYKGVVNPSLIDGQSSDGRFSYDVFFVPKAAVGAACGKKDEVPPSLQLAKEHELD